MSVVYLLIPTSNHNLLNLHTHLSALYIFWFLHQTTTNYLSLPNGDVLYIFWFLYQTTTTGYLILNYICCISFDSYIKPQRSVHRLCQMPCCISFDSYIKPQLYFLWGVPCQSCISFDSYIKPQPIISPWIGWAVVYLLIPTSNHNQERFDLGAVVLYIFWFLHQTTTVFVLLSWIL